MKGHTDVVGATPVRPWLIVLIIAACWTFIVAYSLHSSQHLEQEEVLAVSRAEARGVFQKDLVYRRWAAGHGGVYVVVDESTPPNPYLEHVDEREVTTASGRTLTLMNPAYMTRQVHDLGAEQYGVLGHITSLEPINPINVPDPWEREALLSFEAGATEAEQVSLIDGEEHMRLMLPMLVEQRCLKCHGDAGYEIGQVRGGVSVSVPLASYRAHQERHVNTLRMGHGAVWLVGLLGLLLSSVSVIRRIREREAVTAALGQSEAMFHDLYDSAPVAHLSVSADGAITRSNDAARKLTGLSAEQLLGSNIADLCEAGSRDKALQILENFERPEGVHNEELALKSTVSESLHCLVTVRPVRDQTGHLLEGRWVLVDITERTRIEAERGKLEAQVHRSQKLEAVGQLAGGIAHDFNNILQALSGYNYFALEVCEPEHPAREELRATDEGIERAAALTRQLLAFSRRQILKPEVIDLRLLVDGLSKMLRRVIGEHIELVLHTTEDLASVKADPGQIEQVLLNLVINARDAMPEGGRVVIETHDQVLDDSYLIRHPWAKPGPYVELSVTDHGCGMDAAVLSRVFEPFFTTKPEGTGTGLGLATVYGIIKQHDGIISVYSEPDKGSTFRVFLPAVGAEADIRECVEAQAAPGRGETILVAEDDEAIRSLVSRILRGAGYHVLVAKDGQEALELCRARGAAVQLALLDVVMPKLSGRRVHDYLREHHPDVRILFASGYSANGIHTNFILDEGLNLVQKPYKPTELLSRIRELLDG